MDRRLFLSLLSGAPAVSLIGISACQREASPVTPPPLAALRKFVADDVDPAIVFQPLRRKS